MRISDRAHIVTGVCNLISLPLTAVSLFTCGWMSFTTIDEKKHTSAIVGYGGSGKCMNMFPSGVRTPAWMQATLGLMCVAFILQIISAIYLFFTWVLWRYKRHKMRVDGVVIPVMIMSYWTAITAYGCYAKYFFKHNRSVRSYSFSYSFYLAISAGILTTLSTIPLLIGYYHIEKYGDHNIRDKVVRF